MDDTKPLNEWERVSAILNSGDPSNPELVTAMYVPHSFIFVFSVSFFLHNYIFLSFFFLDIHFIFSNMTKNNLAQTLPTELGQLTQVKIMLFFWFFLAFTMIGFIYLFILQGL